MWPLIYNSRPICFTSSVVRKKHCILPRYYLGPVIQSPSGFLGHWSTVHLSIIILILIVSELQCKKAIDQTLVQRVGLKLFVVTFVLTYTFYTLHFSSALTSSKSGIIICTWRCYQGSRIIGKDKTKTEIWETKPLTQRMLLLHPSAVPLLSRLQPPLGSASSPPG